MRWEQRSTKAPAQIVFVWPWIKIFLNAQIPISSEPRRLKPPATPRLLQQKAYFPVSKSTWTPRNDSYSCWEGWLFNLRSYGYANHWSTLLKTRAQSSIIPCSLPSQLSSCKNIIPTSTRYVLMIGEAPFPPPFSLYMTSAMTIYRHALVNSSGWMTADGLPRRRWKRNSPLPKYVRWFDFSVCRCKC